MLRESISVTKGQYQHLETFDGVSIKPGYLMQVTERSSDIYRPNEKGNVDCSEWTDPWKGSKDRQGCLRLKAIMRGRRVRRRQVAAGAIKLFYSWRVGKRHSVAVEYSQQGSPTNAGRKKSSNGVKSPFTLPGSKKVTSTSGMT